MHTFPVACWVGEEQGDGPGTDPPLSQRSLFRRHERLRFGLAERALGSPAAEADVAVGDDDEDGGCGGAAGGAQGAAGGQ